MFGSLACPNRPCIKFLVFDDSQASRGPRSFDEDVVDDEHQLST